jgi:prevent-host-death family protein
MAGRAGRGADAVIMMPEIRVPIGQVKRDLSDLVNRVAYGGERIPLMSRGKPKVALVSIEDYQRLGLSLSPPLRQHLGGRATECFVGVG